MERQRGRNGKECNVEFGIDPWLHRMNISEFAGELET